MQMQMEEGVFAIVMMKRSGGCLLALPQGFLGSEGLAAAEVPGETMGPSHAVLVQSVMMEDGIQTGWWLSTFS